MTGRRPKAPSPAMLVALVALVLSTTGLADAARKAVVSALCRAPDQRQAARRRDPAARAQPQVRGRGDPDGSQRLAKVGGKTAAQLEGQCLPDTVDVGTWCIESAPFPLTKEDLGKNNFIWASRKCEEEGGWLPSASELLGAVERIKLESTIHDSQLTATIPLDPTRGLKDEREMSSTLTTTEAGSMAAGFEGVSEGATGNPRQGQANPTPLPADPLPESLQYVTVYDNGNKGGFAGSEPVDRPGELPLRLRQVARRPGQGQFVSARGRSDESTDPSQHRSHPAPLA